MAYNKFAYIYDQLMDGAPYKHWIEYIERISTTYQEEVKTILDVGCGTGTLAIPLAKEGYDVKGVDLSEDMLMVAQEKADQSKVRLQFFQQNMSELNGFYPTDLVTIFCDSINYLDSESNVKSTFESVYKNLRDGGLFLFDIHSQFKIQNIFVGKTFAQEEEHLSYIWECYKGNNPLSVEHELSFFVHLNNNMYEKFTETHKQRTFPLDHYKKWLKETGFEILEITADFTENTPNEESERIFFACVKK
jgi:predicted TPR repeat methyltransferase